MTSDASDRDSSPAPRPVRESRVRRAERQTGAERRETARWPSDAEVEIVSPVQLSAVAEDVGMFGLRLAVSGWLSTGTVCEIRIKTRSGRLIAKRARVVWARRTQEGCVAGLRIVGFTSSMPPRTR